MGEEVVDVSAFYDGVLELELEVETAPAVELGEFDEAKGFVDVGLR